MSRAAQGSKTTGLIAVGGVNRSFLARMPVLLRSVGPIKAASLGVARRIANTLRAGEAVANYSALADCDLIWISIPDTGLDRVFRDLAGAIPLAGKTAVLCGSTRDSDWHSSLVAAGVRVATLNCIEESREQIFVGEGEPIAMRELRRILSTENRKLIDLRRSSKSLYFAGVHLATDLLLPWIAASVESLRNAGLSRAEATRVASALGTRALRDYAKAGPKAWSAAAAHRLRQSISLDLESVREVDPRLADLYADGVELALRYFEPRK